MSPANAVEEKPPLPQVTTMNSAQALSCVQSMSVGNVRDPSGGTLELCK